MNNPNYLKRKKAPDIKSWIFKLIFSKVGPLVKVSVSTLLGYFVVWLASFGIILDADMQFHIANSLTGLIWLIIDQLITRYAGDQAKAIQQALGVEADKWIGPETVAAAEAKRPIEILD